jgi:hypothetical protein
LSRYPDLFVTARNLPHSRFTQGFCICTLGLYSSKPYLNLIWSCAKTLTQP